jgi:hypothetical protein
MPSVDAYWAANPKQRHAIRMLWFCEWEAGNDEARKFYQEMLLGTGWSETVYQTPFGEDRDLW